MPGRARPAAGGGGGRGGGRGGRGGRRRRGGRWRRRRGGGRGAGRPATAPPRPLPTDDASFPAGSYIVRMDQPYSRIADALLDYQYWAPNDPQKTPYDDTGLDVPRGLRRAGGARDRREGARRADGSWSRATSRRASGVTGTGIDLRDQPQRRQRADHAALQAEGRRHPDGRGAVRRRRAEVRRAARSSSRASRRPISTRPTTELGLKAYALAAAPSVKMHPARAARVAILHTWSSTQTEGWWRAGVRRLRHPVRLHRPGDIAQDRRPASRSTT